MRFPGRFSLRAKLVFLYAVLLIFSVGIVSYYSYWSIWQTLINNKTAHIRARAKPVIEHWLETRGLHSPDSVVLTGESVRELAYDLTSRDGVAVILNREGEVIASGKRLPEEMEPPPVDPEYFQEALSGNNEVDYLLEINKERLLIVLIPVRPKPGSNKICGVIQISTSLSEINKILLQHSARLITVVLVILIAGILLGYWLTGMSLQELKELSGTCQKIAKGDFSLRADVGNRKDEIGTLGDSFNLMIDKLEHLFKSQKRFAANAAHELLTPLTGLRGSLEVLLRGAQDDRETLRRLTTGMYKEVNHLIRLCDQLLGLSRLENTANISKRSIMLNEFMKDFLNKAKSLTRSHSLVVQEGPFVRFMADPGLLEQMLFNLIANAVHYSATDTTLLIEWTLIPGFVKLCITDQGEGMDEETLEHVFEPFYRGGNRKYSNEKGAGLGLALTKSMIEAHGGSIRIESTPGEGTTVCLTFPL